MQYARKQYMEQLIRKKDNGRIKVIILHFSIVGWAKYAEQVKGSDEN